MPALPLPNGRTQFIDANGAPLVGGQVFHYIPGTTEPKSTWQDAGQTILNTNPIILDDLGSAAIWGAGAYRQIVDDVDGNQIWDQVTQTANTIDASGPLYLASNFGILPNNAANNAALLIAAAATMPTGGKILFGAYEYLFAQPIVLGNGTNTSYSTINGIELCGVGAPFIRIDSPGSPLEDNGTRFKYVGAPGATLLRINGPCAGMALSNIALNGNGLAAIGLDITSGTRVRLDEMTIAACTSRQMRAATITAELIDGSPEAIGTEGITSRGLRIVAAETIGIDMDGYIGSTANGWDTVRCSFDNTYILVSLNGGTGVRLAYTDLNSFTDISMTGYGVANGLAASFFFVGTQTVPGGFNFPQNVRISRAVDTGQNLPLRMTGVIGHGNRIDGNTGLDNQIVIQDPESRYIAYTQLNPQGDWAEGGQNILERSLRNKFRNSRMARASRGTTVNAVASSGYSLDDFILIYDGAVTANISQQLFTVGQTDVPYQPKYFMRVQIAAAAGGTFLYLGQRLPRVETLGGKMICLSAFMKAGAPRTVQGRCQQVFGTGGSPSGTQGANLDDAAVLTTWKRFAQTGTLSSIAGKTLGSNGNDYLGVYWALPINTVETYDIALSQCEGGYVATAFEQRPTAVDEQISAQFLRKVGSGVDGGWGSATFAQLGMPLSPPMRAAPAVSALGVSVSLKTAGDTTYTAVPGVVSAVSTTNGAQWAATGFTGATAFRPVGCQTDGFLLSAEL